MNVHREDSLTLMTNPVRLEQLHLLCVESTQGQRSSDQNSPTKFTPLRSIVNQSFFSGGHKVNATKSTYMESTTNSIDVCSDALPYFTTGEVVKGFGRGSKELGIPTG